MRWETLAGTVYLEADGEPAGFSAGIRKNRVCPWFQRESLCSFVFVSGRIRRPRSFPARKHIEKLLLRFIHEFRIEGKLSHP
ncbi:MAG: hypothetical protein N2035_09975 [Chthoniobacterales bacterium]|nr:hypothetical protein [Chthoniobacterales bacterium]MCX7713968.1 hypothetical protein [Chthoniobacterales bacterium]